MLDNKSDRNTDDSAREWQRQTVREWEERTNKCQYQKWKQDIMTDPADVKNIVRKHYEKYVSKFDIL